MGLRPGKTKGPWVGKNAVAPVDSYKVKVDDTDSTPDYLRASLIAGAGISISTVDIAGDHFVQLTATPQADVKVSATGADSTPDYLSSKLTGSGCSISTVGAGGTNQKTLITVTPPTVPTKYRQFHTFNPDMLDIEGGASVTDYVTSNGNRLRVVEFPEGSDVHLSVPIHPKYDGSGIAAKLHWVVNDASHNTAHELEYNAAFYRNTDSLNVNETEVNWTIQADTANDLLYIDSATLTVQGTYNTAGTLMHFRLAHKSSCAASGPIKILAIEISYYATLE